MKLLTGQNNSMQQGLQRMKIPVCILDVQNIDETYQELVSKGIKLNPPVVAPYGMKQLYLHDPDGTAYVFNGRTAVYLKENHVPSDG